MDQNCHTSKTRNMPRLPNAMNSISSNAGIDEHQWVIQIRRTLDEEDLKEDAEIPVSIFSVPKTLMASHPDSYVPQVVALGLHHYWRPELYDMQRYKLSAAKRVQKQLHNIKFRHLVDHLIKLEPRIRASYHKYLDFNGETLAWMMAVDATFLFEFLQIFAIKEGASPTSSRMSHLVDIAGRKSAHNAILKDIVMLENQIPLFLLREMLEFQFSSIELADTMLLSMLVGLCKEVSPFKMLEDLPNVHVANCAHLLDFLYRAIVPKSEEPSEVIEIEEESEVIDQAEENSFRKLLSKLNEGPIPFFKRVLWSKPIKLISKLPWIIISNLPGFRVFTQIAEHLCFFPNKEEVVKPENENSDSNNNNNKPPLVEEITIPSVTELNKAGVIFSPANGGILTTSFDNKTATLHLPTINLDLNTEVILRNLVAYEACNASGPLIFTRYIELMNGIIDTGEDAKLLRERGIVLNHLKSDEEVAKMWNGMSKSVRLTKVPFLDRVIEDVNKYYDGRWKIKVGKFMELYVFGSWQFLSLIAVILFLLLMTLQVFCSVYGCARKRIFHVKNIL